MAYFLSTLLWGVRVALGLARVGPLIELFFMELHNACQSVGGYAFPLGLSVFIRTPAAGRLADCCSRCVVGREVVLGIVCLFWPPPRELCCFYGRDTSCSWAAWAVWRLGRACVSGQSGRTTSGLTTSSKTAPLTGGSIARSISLMNTQGRR